MITRRRLWAALSLALFAACCALAWHAAAGKRDRPVRAGDAAIASDARSEEVRVRFEQAVVMLHAKQYEHAVTALHRVLELAPALPEAQVNMGFAMLGLGRSDAARSFFEAALALRSTQANAYYGLALAAEGARDLPAALGAMRSYLHLSRADDPQRARARSAIWEWEQALGPDRRPASVAQGADAGASRR